MKMFRWLAVAACCAALAACGGGGGDSGVRGTTSSTASTTSTTTTPVALFTTMPDGLQMQPGGAKQTFQIKGGSGLYTASSSNMTVATVALDSSGTGLVVTPLSTGSASVVVRDSLGITDCP